MVKRFSGAQAGFSLLELSVVLAITSVMVSGGLVVGTSVVERAAYVDSEALLDQANQTLQDFYKTNGYLPCPASLNDKPDTEAFGKAGDCTKTFPDKDANGNSVIMVNGAVEDTNGHTIRTGMLPVKALGLPPSAASDKFGNRFVYSVTKTLAVDPQTFEKAPKGLITIQDGGGNELNGEAAYFLGSMGKDEKGAVSFKTGVAVSSCVATGLDALNCDYGKTAAFRDAQFNNGSQPSKYFDDLVRWVPKFHLEAVAQDGDTLWAPTADGDNIYSRGVNQDTKTTKVGIGTDKPESMLDVVFDHQTPGWSNDLLVRRYENDADPLRSHSIDASSWNVRDWSPVTFKQARGTQASPENILPHDGLGGLLDVVRVGGGWENTAWIQNVYTGNEVSSAWYDWGKNTWKDTETKGSAMFFGTSNRHQMVLDENGWLKIGHSTLLQKWNPTPSGWGGGGLHAWDVFVESTIGVSRNSGVNDGTGQLAAYINRNGDGYFGGNVRVGGEMRLEKVVTSGEPCTNKGAIASSANGETMECRSIGSADPYWRPVGGLAEADIATITKKACWGDNRDVNVLVSQCPTGYRLLSCGGGAGDVQEGSTSTSWHLYADYQAQLCRGEVVRPSCTDHRAPTDQTIVEAYCANSGNVPKYDPSTVVIPPSGCEAISVWYSTLGQAAAGQGPFTFVPTDPNHSVLKGYSEPHSEDDVRFQMCSPGSPITWENAYGHAKAEGSSFRVNGAIIDSVNGVLRVRTDPDYVAPVADPSCC